MCEWSMCVWLICCRQAFLYSHYSAFYSAFPLSLFFVSCLLSFLKLLYSYCLRFIFCIKLLKIIVVVSVLLCSAPNKHLTTNLRYNQINIDIPKSLQSQHKTQLGISKGLGNLSGIVRRRHLLLFFFIRRAFLIVELLVSTVTVISARKICF